MERIFRKSGLVFHFSHNNDALVPPRRRRGGLVLNKVLSNGRITVEGFTNSSFAFYVRVFHTRVIKVKRFTFSGRSPVAF